MWLNCAHAFTPFSCLQSSRSNGFPSFCSPWSSALLHFVTYNVISRRDPRQLVHSFTSCSHGQTLRSALTALFCEGVPADPSRIRGSLGALIARPDACSYQSCRAASQQSTASVKSVQRPGLLHPLTVFTVHSKKQKKKTETPAHGWWDFVLVALFLSVFSFCVENWRTGPNVTVQVLRAPTMESDQIHSSDLFCYLNSHIHSTIQPTAATRSAEMTTISRTLQHYRESKQNHNENIRVQRLHKVSGCYVRRVCFVAPSFAVIWKLLKGRGGDSSCSLTTL